MPEEFEKRMSRLDQAIEKATIRSGKIMNFARNSAAVSAFALGAMILTKSPVFAIVFGASAVVTLGIAVAGIMNDSYLNRKHIEKIATIAEMNRKPAANEPEPAQKLDSRSPGINKEFDGAARVDQLAKDVAELKKEVKGQPVILDKKKHP